MAVWSWLGCDLFLVGTLKLGLWVVSILAVCSTLLPRLSFWAQDLASVLYGMVSAWDLWGNWVMMLVGIGIPGPYLDSTGPLGSGEGCLAKNCTDAMVA